MILEIADLVIVLILCGAVFFIVKKIMDLFNQNKKNGEK